MTLNILADVSPLLAALPPHEGALVGPRLERRRHRRGAVVLAQGDPPQGVFLILRGAADVIVQDAAGNEEWIDHLGPGGVFGEVSALAHQPVTGTVRATADLDVLVLPQRDLEALAGRCPALLRTLAGFVSSRLERSTYRTVRPRAGTVTLLPGTSGDGQAEALAASVAWHTRRRALLLAFDDYGSAAPPALPTWRLQPHAPETSQRRAATGAVGAEVALAGPLAAWSPAAAAFAVDELRREYQNILVTARGPLDEVLASSAVRRVEPQRLHRGDIEKLRAGAGAVPGGAELSALAREVAGVRVGLALGAGSIRGYAHIGVLRVLERVGLAPDTLAGSSVGSVVAGLYALGYDAATAEAVFNRNAHATFRLSIPTRGLMSSAGLAEAMRRYGGDRRIEDLPLPVGIVAADINDGREVVFRRGELWRAVMASVSMPGIYPAHRIGRRVLVDGGVLNPVPASVAAELGADVVIGVRLGGAKPERDAGAEAVGAGGAVPSILAVFRRTLGIMQQRLSLEVASGATILIEPGRYGRSHQRGPSAELRRFADGRRHIELGEAAAEAALPQIAAHLPWLAGDARTAA